MSLDKYRSQSHSDAYLAEIQARLDASAAERQAGLLARDALWETYRDWLARTRPFEGASGRRRAATTSTRGN